MTPGIDSVRDWLAEHPPPPERFTQTLATVARRVAAGDELWPAVREWLDELAVRPTPELRATAISERPIATGDPRADALLAALAEHAATHHGLDRPGWCLEPHRFLDRFWFVSDVPAFRAIAVAQSPAAFRRRGIFLAASALERR